MAVPSRRTQRRYHCDLPVEVFSFISEVRVAQGRLLNLSIAGAMLGCDSPLHRGITYFFRLPWRSSLLELTGRVVWTSPRDQAVRRYGIQLNLTRDQEMLLRGLVDSLRLAERPTERVYHDIWKPRSVK